MAVKEVMICDCDHEHVNQEQEVFGAAGIEFEWLQSKDQDEVIRTCRGAKVLLNQYVYMDRKIFEAMPELRCIVRYGVGYNNINIPDATEYGVQVCNVPDYGTCEVADQALALMMALTRKVCLANDLVHQGIWDYSREVPIFRLGQCTVGVYGMGRIGTEFAKRAAAFGCKMIACEINENAKAKAPGFIEFVDFEEMLRRSDIISIHSPLDEKTYHRFGKAEFAAMKPTAYVVNVARGGIIDEDALLEALQTKQIAGAGLDVVEHEPLAADDPLLQAKNLIITPHTAWYSEQASVDLKRKAAEEAVRFIRGEQLHYPLNLNGK